MKRYYNTVVQITQHPINEFTKYFMAGFFEGEGSMSISIKISEDRKTKVQLAPEINVTQLHRGIHILN
jgi:hypothetical protein